VTEARTYPHGVTCWVDTEQADVDDASGFYAALFGWTLTNAMPPGEPASYLIATFNGLDVAVTRAGGRVVSPPAQWRVTFTVTDRDESVATAEGLVATVLDTSQDLWTRKALLRDRGAPSSSSASSPRRRRYREQMKLKPAETVTTAPLAALGLIGGYLTARESGIRPLGGVLLGACGAYAGRTWLAKRGPGVTAALSAVYVLGFGLSHPLAKKIGAWPAVLAVTAASAGASHVLSDAHD
jgi:predicted enzyme related to lactoylglutathione lyase